MKFYKKPEFYFAIHTALHFILFFFIYITTFNKILDKWTIFNFSIIIISISILINITFLSIRNKSLKYYKKLVSKIEESESGAELSQLAKFKFPEEDELGRLGSVLNKLILNLCEFDNLKKEKIILFKKEISFFLNFFEKPIIITGSSGEIISYNKACESFIDIKKDNLPKNIIELFEYSHEIKKILEDVYKNKSEDFFQQFSKIVINGKLYNSIQISGFKQKTNIYTEYIILFSF